MKSSSKAKTKANTKNKNHIDPSPTVAEISPFPSLTINPLAELSSPHQGIYIIDDLFTYDINDAVLNWARGLKLDGPKIALKGEAERTGNRTSIPSTSISSSLLPLLKPFIPLLEPKYTSSQPTLSSNIRVYHYPPGTYFGKHYDSPQLDQTPHSLSGGRRLSCWTVLMYLTDVQGGETTFYPPSSTKGIGNGKIKVKSKSKSEEEEKIIVQPKAGRALLHWHGMTHGGCLLHQGESVVSGDKWVLRTDIMA